MSKFVMIIFGASGDLTKRKLIPALYNLYKDNRLPEGFAVLGIGRTGYRMIPTVLIYGRKWNVLWLRKNMPADV